MRERKNTVMFIFDKESPTISEFDNMNGYIWESTFGRKYSHGDLDR